MATAELLIREEKRRQWEPYLTLVLSKREAFYLANILADIDDWADKTRVNDGIFQAITRFHEVDLTDLEVFDGGAALSGGFMKLVEEVRG